MESSRMLRSIFYIPRTLSQKLNFASLWMVKYKDIVLGFLSFTTSHGLNPHISRAAGQCKLILWTILFLIGVGGLCLHFHSITTRFISYEVSVKTMTSHVTQTKFPAVSVCNLNPIKKSLLGNSVQLQALIDGWDVRGSRTKRDASHQHPHYESAHSRQKRSIALTPLTDCPVDAQFSYGQYCYVIEVTRASWDDSQTSCEANQGNLVWFDTEEELAIINQMYCQVFSCGAEIRKYWTGLYDAVGQDIESDYIFTSGSSPTFFSWESGEPSLAQDLCVENRRTSGTYIWEWNDQGCSFTRNYICKYRYASRTDNSTLQYEVTACENTTANVSCSGNDTIHIVSVFYGRDSDSICTSSSLNTSYTDCTCDSSDGTGGCVLSVLQTCENAASCEANATTDAMGVDPCSGVSKYLRITYECWNLEIPPDTTVGTTEGLTTEPITTQHVDSTTNHLETETSMNEATTSDDVTLAPTSMYEERDPYREDFLEEEDLLRVLADIPIEEKQQLGYNLTEVVADCTFEGRNCDMGKFVSFYHGTYGNCYAFNSGWNSEKKLHISRTGRESGLRLMIKLGQEEYIPQVGEAAGAVVVIHPQERFPFPEDEGILVLPGHINSIGTKEIKIRRIGGHYGNCTNIRMTQDNINVFEEWYPKTKYSRSACFKTCYQKYVIKQCGCSDPAYPMTGKALGVWNITACDSRNIVQDDCTYSVSLDYITGKLECGCLNPCNEKLYKYSLSRSLWPSEANADTFHQTYAHYITSYENFTDDPEFYRRNFLTVEVFFESLQLETLKERPNYTLTVYISDIGSIVGLWLGLTIFSILELLELLTDIIVLSCTKLFHWTRLKTKRKDSVAHISIHQDEQLDNFKSLSPRSRPRSRGGTAVQQTIPVLSRRSTETQLSGMSDRSSGSSTVTNSPDSGLVVKRRRSVPRRTKRKVSPLLDC